MAQRTRYMPTRLSVRLTAAQAKALEERAAREFVSRSAFVRRAIARSLAEAAPPSAEAPALAALVAAEHTLRLLQTIVPDGAARSAQVKEAAAQEAWRRLESVHRDQEARRG